MALECVFIFRTLQAESVGISCGVVGVDCRLQALSASSIDFCARTIFGFTSQRLDFSDGSAAISYTVNDRVYRVVPLSTTQRLDASTIAIY